MSSDISNFNFSVEEKDSHFDFLFDNLPQNMGITLGNYLRRFLLDYSKGISPIGIRIKGVNSPFSLIPGSRDVFHIICQRIKKVILECPNDKDFLEIFDDEKIFRSFIKVANDSEKERKITARDIIFEDAEKIIIKNDELYITSLSPKEELEIVIYWRGGWGYKTSEENKFDNDVIALDADFSPIKLSKVSFNVEKLINKKNKRERMILKIFKPENGDYLNIKRLFKMAISQSLEIFSDISSKMED